MQGSEKKHISKIYMKFICMGMLSLFTILFFAGERLLADGWSYVPDRANRIALILCILWQCMSIVMIRSLASHLKEHTNGRGRVIISTMSVIAVILIILLSARNWILYSMKSDEKVEQYDEHIALYVDSTFVRTEYRYPYYMYEEYGLFMRQLSEDELRYAISKYGYPSDYYKEYIAVEQSK